MRPLEIAEAGYRLWAENPHNKRWVRKIDGTPIPNDLTVCMAEAFKSALSAITLPEAVAQDGASYWMIEMNADPQHSQPRWWAGMGIGWTIDHDAAIHFARRADAEKGMAASYLASLGRATEHVTIATPPSPASPAVGETEELAYARFDLPALRYADDVGRVFNEQIPLVQKKAKVQCLFIEAMREAAAANPDRIEQLTAELARETCPDCGHELSRAGENSVECEDCNRPARDTWTELLARERDEAREQLRAAERQLAEARKALESAAETFAQIECQGFSQTLASDSDILEWARQMSVNASRRLRAP